MNLFNFTANFGSEEACRLHFKEQRDKIGVECKCGSREHFWIQSRWSYECKKCRSRISLRSGTIMQSSKLSFLTWYKTMFLMSATKKGFSSKEIQKQLGQKRYEPVWSMVHKLRKAMGNRDARYTLEGMIEFDEGYFTVESSEIEQEKGIRGRGAVGKENVAIMAESTVLEDLESGKKSTQCRYFKAKVLTDHTAEQINQTIQESINEKSIVFTDKSTSYVDISNFVELHITEKSNKETTKETLKWVHITISNAKRNLLGNYHKIKGKYLQLYLNEFVYKLNRRYFEEKLFDRLVIANITGLWQKTDNQYEIYKYYDKQIEKSKTDIYYDGYKKSKNEIQNLISKKRSELNANLLYDLIGNVPVNVYDTFRKQRINKIIKNNCRTGWSGVNEYYFIDDKNDTIANFSYQKWVQ